MSQYHHGSVSSAESYGYDFVSQSQASFAAASGFHQHSPFGNQNFSTAPSMAYGQGE
jgi:hypothetical protein